MKFSISKWIALGCLGIAPGIWAATNTMVEAVQSPVWMERDGKLRPVAPGMELRNRDRLLTGNGARAVVQLGDGSAVKLGENARMDFNALGQRPDGAFTAALDVAKGAFRLTTNVLRKWQSPRAINVRIGTVTAGIRGTDIWGRSDAGRDLVCLLEGHIIVSHPQAEPLELTEALQFYGADKGKAPGPIAMADPAKIAEWSRTTEFVADSATLRQRGAWAVRAITAANETEALENYDRITAAGYPVRIQPRKGKQGYRYELVLGSLASREEAQLLADRLTSELGLGSATALGRQAALRRR